MTYREEFPDFPAADLPSIPSDWRDTSWHNDSCPSWETPTLLEVYVDFANDVEREMPGGSRFCVMMHNGEIIMGENDWQAVLAFVHEYPTTVLLSKDDDTLDSYVRDWCHSNSVQCDGDVFGLVFSGSNTFTMAETADTLKDAARTYGLNPLTPLTERIPQ